MKLKGLYVVLAPFLFYLILYLGLSLFFSQTTKHDLSIVTNMKALKHDFETRYDAFCALVLDIMKRHQPTYHDLIANASRESTEFQPEEQEAFIHRRKAKGRKKVSDLDVDCWYWENVQCTRIEKNS